MNRFRGGFRGGIVALLAVAISGCAATVKGPAGPTDRGAIEALLLGSPQRADLWRDLGWIDYLAGDSQKAHPSLERAEKLAAGDPRTLLGLALLAHTAGRTDEARGRWASILERADPEDPWSAPVMEMATSVLEWLIGEAPGEQAFSQRLSGILASRASAFGVPIANTLPFDVGSRLFAVRAAYHRKLGDDGLAATLDAARGCPKVWRAAGPYGHLARLDLDRPLPPATSHPVAGRALPVRACGFAVEANRASVMHATTFVQVPRDLTATVSVETDQPWHLVVDGQTVFRQDPRDRFPTRSTGVDLDLAAGWHRVLLKIAVPHSRTEVVASIASPGAPLEFADAAPAAGAAVAPGPARLHPAIAMPVAVGTATGAGTYPAAIGDFLVAARAHRELDLDGGSAAIARVNAAAPRFVPGLLLGAQLAAEDPSRPSRFSRDAARKLLERTLELEPGAGRARYNLATMDLQDDHAEKALARLGDHPGWRLDYGRYQALRARGWLLEAERALAEARKQNPEACGPIEAAMAVARDHHDVAAARRLGEEMVRCQPTSDDLAELYRDTRDPRAAAVEYRRLLALDPLRQDWRNGLADALTAAGQPGEAVAVLEALVAEYPRSAGQRVKLADALIAGGRPGDAARARQVIADGLAEAPEAQELHRALLALGLGNVIDPFRVDGKQVIAAFNRSGRRYDAPAVIVLDRTVTRVFDTGARLTLTHNIVRVQTKEGIDKWGEVNIPDGADVLLLRAVKADGSTREPEEIAEKQSVSVPDLEPGDFVEFEYVDPSPSPAAFPNGFLGERFYFQSFDAPLDRTEYVLAAPPGMALQIDRRGDALKEKVELRGELEVRTWADEHKAQLLPEPQQAPFTESVPSVRVASGVTFPVWRDFLDDQQFGALRANGELRALAAKLKTPEAVDAFVRRNIKAGGSLDEAATSILARGEGNRITLERALLLALGVPAELWLGRARNSAALDGPLPDLEGFDEPLLAVTLPGAKGPVATTILDPRFRHTPMGFVSPPLRDQPAIALGRRGEARPVTVTTRLADRREITLEATLAEDGGAEVTVREVVAGWPALEWREGIDRLAEDRVRPEFEQHTLGFYFPGATLKTLTFGPRDADDEPFVVAYTFHAPRFARAEGKRLLLPAPYPALLGRRYVGVAKRSTPLQLQYCAPTHLAATIHLPAGAGVARAVSGKASDPLFGAFSLLASGGASGEPPLLKLDATFGMPASRIPPERYGEFAAYAHAVDVAESQAAEVVLK